MSKSKDKLIIDVFSLDSYTWTYQCWPTCKDLKITRPVLTLDAV